MSFTVAEFHDLVRLERFAIAFTKRSVQNTLHESLL